MQKNTGYLLIDVADHVESGIFELAATALRLSATVNYQMPVIDPTLYIDRFTDELKFGRLAPEIKETAIQIIRRLNRDWIQTGRKPAGVCGAAILLAAKIHRVDVPRDKILKCARVCNSTINKRLKEIAKTELAKASINDLRNNQDIINEESRELPPSMKIKKQLEEFAVQISSKKEETEINETFSDDDIKDIDSMILTEEETEKRSALFYTMYKSKINQMPKDDQPDRKRKKDQEASLAKLDEEIEGEYFHDNDEIDGEEFHDDDEIQSDEGDF